MGGKPLTALNLIMFPTGELGQDCFNEILRGGNNKIVEAGAILAGGHSVDDEEPKYGLSVTGIAHPDKILTNCGIKVGDALILTKPLGTGILFNACRDGLLPYSDLEIILPQIAALNAKAMEVALKFNVNACTDVTGFGILGHIMEMAQLGHQITLSYKALNIYPHALEMQKKGVSTKISRGNKEELKDCLTIDTRLSKEEEEILYDPQTSGGLLISIPSEKSGELLRALKKAGIEAASIVGEVMASDKPCITIV